MSFVQELLKRSLSCFCVGEERVEEKTEREEELSNVFVLKDIPFWMSDLQVSVR